MLNFERLVEFKHEDFRQRKLPQQKHRGRKLQSKEKRGKRGKGRSYIKWQIALNAQLISSEWSFVAVPLEPR